MFCNMWNDIKRNLTGTTLPCNWAESWHSSWLWHCTHHTSYVDTNIKHVLWEWCRLPRAQTPHLAKCQWYIAPTTTTWRKKVQLRVQVEEEEIGETHGKEQSEEPRVKERTTAPRGWPCRWGDALVQTPEPMWCITHHSARALCKRKSDVWGALSTHPVGYSRLLSTNIFSWIKRIELISSTSFWTLWYCWKGMGSARSSPDSRWRRFLIVTAALKSDRSRIGAFLPDLFNVRYNCPSYLLNSSLDRR